MKSENPVDQFWEAVMLRDYDTVRTAIADGFDVNAMRPGKVAPITLAQSENNMVMLKILWEAGAFPATPWLVEVFADFANGGDGSKFKIKKSKPVGTFVLSRFNGDEVFNLERAVIHIEKYGNKSCLVIEARTNGSVVKSLPDTVELHAEPNAQIILPVSDSEINNLVGKKFSLPNSYDKKNNNYAATIYYVEHEPIDANEIEFVSRKKDKFSIKWTGLTKDVNYYDGSKPNTSITIEGWFTSEKKNVA
jgi:hypothetical protein